MSRACWHCFIRRWNGPEAEGFPYYSGIWRQPEEVLNKLIVPLTRDWNDFSAVADDFIAEGDRVVSLGAYGGVSKATGKTMRAPFAHVWRIADGKLKRFDMYTDTLLVARAMQGLSKKRFCRRHFSRKSGGEKSRPIPR